MNKVLDDLSKTNLNLNKINYLQKTLNDFILQEYEKHKQYLQKIRVFDIGDINWDEFIQKEVDDATSDIEMKLLILKKAAQERLSKFWWDVGKILFSAIIGGVIGAFIKNLI